MTYNVLSLTLSIYTTTTPIRSWLCRLLRLSTGTVYGLRATDCSVMRTAESAVKAVVDVLVVALRGARRATQGYKYIDRNAFCTFNYTDTTLQHYIAYKVY